nr:8464_t:CDS:2 [Entrophospora candida]CAG8507152.1 574_t:CDS:2 [Entrophospora candida]
MLLLPLMNINRFTILHQQQRRFIFQTLPASRRLYDILEIPLDADKKLVKSQPNVRKHTHHNFHESNFRRTSRTDDTHKTNNSNTSSSSSKDFKNKFNFQEHYQRHYSEELRRANSESSKEKNQSLENQLKSSHGRTVLRIVLIVSTLVLFGSSGGGIMI